MGGIPCGRKCLSYKDLGRGAGRAGVLRHPRARPAQPLWDFLALLALKPGEKLLLRHDDAIVLRHTHPLGEKAIAVDKVEEILEGSHITE